MGLTCSSNFPYWWPLGVEQWLTSVILATQKTDKEDCCLKPAQANSLRPYLENTQPKKGWQVEQLPSKH
jgi:hypothetical protein